MFLSCLKCLLLILRGGGGRGDRISNFYCNRTRNVTDPDEMQFNEASHLGIHSVRVSHLLDPVYQSLVSF